MPDPDLVQPIFATLAVLLQAATVAAVAFAVAAWLVPAARSPFDRLCRALADPGLPLAAAIATVAMLGSLYFSESAGYVPCVLCWYQRIAMYPLAVVLVLAAVRGDWAIRPYALLLAVPGLLISLYHRQLQLWPDQESLTCDAEAPCTVQWLQEFGYISIPVLAGTAFAGVVILLLLGGRGNRLHDQQ